MHPCCFLPYAVCKKSGRWQGLMAQLGAGADGRVLSQVYAGDELGYSTTPQTKDMTIAVLDVGSIDGADDVDKAVVRGIVVPVVGDGGMNMHMLDVTNVPGVQVNPPCLSFSRISLGPPASEKSPRCAKQICLTCKSPFAYPATWCALI